MSFPVKRLQRLRVSPSVRALFQETRLHPSDFVQPLFVKEDLEIPEPIGGLPGQFRYGVNSTLVEVVKRMMDTGLMAVILFGIPRAKDPSGTASYDTDGVVQKAIGLLKATFPTLVVMADCCLCEYTSHGHCCVLSESGKPNYPETLETLQRVAISYAKAGVDIIAPSGRMDGIIQAIREGLNTNYEMTALMAYTAKFASAFYGPFREAVGSDGFAGDRRFHQLGPSQSQEAIQEALLDAEQGADILMVKPALPYLDIVHQLKQKIGCPIAAYHVSGEYAMLWQAGQQGIVDPLQGFEESFLSMKRAGANLIISYGSAWFLDAYRIKF